MEILVIWEILAKISGGVKLTPLGFCVDQKTLVFPGLITLTNRRRSDGMHLDGRHGISRLCDGSTKNRP